jgi:hypothetical protein
MLIMDDTDSRVLAVVVVNAAIGLVQWLVRKQIPTMGNGGQMGIYAMLVPLGFGLFGWDLPYWFTALFVIGGLAGLLLSVKKQLAAVRAAD